MKNTLFDVFTSRKENKNEIRLFFINITEILVATIFLVLMLLFTYTSNNNYIKALLYVGVIEGITILLDGYTSLKKKDN